MYCLYCWKVALQCLPFYNLLTIIVPQIQKPALIWASFSSYWAKLSLFEAMLDLYWYFVFLSVHLNTALTFFPVISFFISLVMNDIFLSNLQGNFQINILYSYLSVRKMCFPPSEWNVAYFLAQRQINLTQLYMFGPVRIYF